MVIFTKYKQVFVQFNGTVTLVYNGRDERVRKPDDARENPVLHSCYVVMAMLECLQRRRTGRAVLPNIYAGTSDNITGPAVAPLSQWLRPAFQRSQLMAERERESSGRSPSVSMKITT